MAPPTAPRSSALHLRVYYYYYFYFYYYSCTATATATGLPLVLLLLIIILLLLPPPPPPLLQLLLLLLLLLLPLPLPLVLLLLILLLRRLLLPSYAIVRSPTATTTAIETLYRLFGASGFFVRVNQTLNTWALRLVFSRFHRTYNIIIIIHIYIHL